MPISHGSRRAAFPHSRSRDPGVTPARPSAARPAAPAPGGLVGRRVLVTGATGAIGRPVLDALVSAGAEVHALVRPASSALPGAVATRVGDLTDPASLRRAVDGMDAVVHLAALLHVTDPPPALLDEYRRVNDEATAALVRASIDAGVGRLVYASTITVYGDARPPSGLIDESTPCRPLTPYARTKHAGEQHVLAARTPAGDALGVVLRLAAVYGAGVKGNYRRLVNALARGRYVQVGRGTNRRTLVHEDDVARACVLAVEAPEAAGQVYNVTDGETHEVRRIVGAICAALGRRAPRAALPVHGVRAGLFVLERACALAGTRPPVSRASLDTLLEDVAVDGTRLQRELGFTPSRRLDEGWRLVVEALRRSGELPGR